MKIYSIQNFYNPFKFKSREQNTQPALKYQYGLNCDVISFKAKSYGIDSIKNPTNHCAYCGCKLYNDAQIESLAKEMLKDGSHRLQGDIKSVLEKLEVAQRSEELTIQKQLANKKEIEFYKKFLEQASDKSFLKGEAIFAQVYGMNYDEAFSELKKNLRPLLRTIDHVSPQNLDEDNKDDDINLVEACYCCNHDIKEGMSFAEFYELYRSIKENMPVEKFKYAHAQLLSSSSNSILKSISGTKLIERCLGLFTQRDKCISEKENVEFKISEIAPAITHNIGVCKDEISQNEAEILELKAKLKSISNDEEYKAMLERIKLLAQISTIEGELEALRITRKNISDTKNELENPPKKSKKQKATKTKMSEDEKKQKIASLRQQLIDYNQQIQKKEAELKDTQEELALLDEAYPTPEILQTRKNSFDSIANAYSSLQEEESRLEILQGISSKLEFEIQQLTSEIGKYPSTPFEISKYSPEEQQIYQRYSDLLEALKYITQHQNGNGVKAIVNNSAKLQIEQEMADLQNEQVVIDATNFLKRKDLIAQKDKALKEKEESDKNILSSTRKIEQLKKVTSKCTLEKAREQSTEIAKWIRRLNNKQNYLQIPKTIEKLEAEILLLNRTIDELTDTKERIKSLGLA